MIQECGRVGKGRICGIAQAGGECVDISTKEELGGRIQGKARGHVLLCVGQRIANDLYLEVNKIASSKSICGLSDRMICMTIEDVKVSNSLFVEKRAGHAAMKSSTARR
jgi:hypothetical protein